MTRPKILIVDDEPFNVDYLEQELEELDYETIHAANGEEALNKITSESPDLVLLDIMMPVMDGFEVLGRLNADPSRRNLPVIVISASSDLRSMVRGIQLGAEDYLPKPFEPVLLRARIASSLEKKRLRDMQQLYLEGLERELEIGRKIQQGFLPNELPQIEGWEIAAYFKAAREVAGDFYDAFVLPDGNVLCVVGDVCDKGVGAALFMTLFRSLIRATATSDIYRSKKEAAALTPAERLRHVISFVNSYIANTHDEAGMFATIFIGILNPENHTLTYMNCGHEPPFWVKDGGEMVQLTPTGPLVGVMPEAEFVTREIQMGENDTLVAFTDGVKDALNEAEEPFGNGRLLDVASAGATSAAGLLRNIENRLHEFTGAASQFDDITLMSVKRL